MTLPAVASIPEHVNPSEESPEYDVLVIGGTASGFGAAVSAARMGSKVALIEPTQRLGGMASNGLGATDIRKTAFANGLFEEFRQRVIKHYDGGNGLFYEPSVADSIFKEIASEQPNLQIFYKMRPIKVQTQNGKITSVTAEDVQTSVQKVFHAKIVIDATIEGDVAAWAGADFRVGREARSKEEPHAGEIYYDNNTGDILEGSTGKADRKVMSYAYLLVTKNYGPNADKTIPMPKGYSPEKYRYTTPWKQSWPNNDGRIPNNKYEMNQHPWGIDLPEINYDYPTSNYKQRAEIEEQYKNQALGYLYYLQTEMGLKNLGLPDDEFEENSGFPPTLYVREARRVMGKVLMTEQDITEARARIQPTSIGIGDYPMDSHSMVAPSSPNLRHRGEGEMWLVRQTPWYQIPIGILIPNKISNLLVSSAVSATHVAYGALRMEPVRVSLGQAAGTLANLAVKFNKDPEDIPAEWVQDKLLDQKVQLTWFSDITRESRHFKAIHFMGAHGLYQDEKFLPNEPVTRGEAARLILALKKLLDSSAKVVTFSGPHFADIPYIHPQYEAVESLYAEKIIPGGGNFKPNDAITRGEMARWLVLSLKSISPEWGKPDESPQYSDVSPESKYFPYIQGLYKEHIRAFIFRDPEKGLDEESALGKKFHPDAKITRDDFAMTLFLAYRSLHPMF